MCKIEENSERVGALNYFYLKLVRDMRKLSLLPLGALLLGAAGAVLRGLQLATVFDPSSGLLKRGSGVTTVLLILTVAVFALSLAVALLVSARLDVPRTFRRAFYTSSYLSFAMRALLGLGVTVTAIICGLGGTDLMALTGISRWVFVGFMALTGLAMVAMAYYSYTQRPEKPFLRLISVIPAIFYCYWMVALYRINAGNPVLLDYCYGCMAFAATAVCAYYAAGYTYSRSSVAGMVLVSLVAIFLMTVTLADSYPSGLKLTIAATAVYITDSASRFLSSAFPKPPRAPEKDEK